MGTPYDETGNPQTATLTSYYTFASLSAGFGGAYEVTGTDVKKYYSFGGQTVMRDADGLQYFLTDHLGSVVAVTNATGTLISEQRYLPFGAERTNIGVIAQTDYGYTGQKDLGMGLMDYHARFYSPLLGRFTQPDSIIPDPGNPQAWNRFSYVMNRPVNFNDPTGYEPFSDFIAGFVIEIGRTNMWFSPYHQEVGAIQENESDAMLAGRLVADVASAVLAAAEVSTGVGGATGGGGLCITGVGCLAGAPAIAASGVLIAQGVGTGLRAAEGAGTVLAVFANRYKRSEYGGSQTTRNPVADQLRKKVKDRPVESVEIL